MIEYLYLGKAIFSEIREIVIKDNKCNIKIDLSKELAHQLVHTKAIALSATASLAVLVVVGIGSLLAYIPNLNSGTIHDNGAETMAYADAKPIPNDNNDVGTPVDSF